MARRDARGDFIQKLLDSSLGLLRTDRAKLEKIYDSTHRNDWLTSEPDRGAAAAPFRSHRKRVRRVPPRGLIPGLRAVNRLRDTAAAAIIRRTKIESDALGMTLAPASALRKQRGRDGFAFTVAHRGAGGSLHEPAWVLPQLDAACGQALAQWATTADAGSLPASPAPELTPGTALVVGALFRLIQDPPADERLLRTVAPLELPDDLRKLATTLTKYPKWQTRVRRCDYGGGAGEGCFRYFVDRSPAGNARGCCPSHAVMLVQTMGARAPARKPPRRRPARSARSRPRP